MLWACLLSFSACDLYMSPNGDPEDVNIKIERYDRLQSRYLTTGDYVALKSMNITYPTETRTLIENVLQLGTVDQPNINETLLNFYRDTTLQKIIIEAEKQYAIMDDINMQMSKAFQNLKKKIPNIAIPKIYTQIGALNQSIIVGDESIGICLDKYLGTEFEPYRKYYFDYQINSMTREYIVPDCLTFYILSCYPLKNFEEAKQEIRDRHMGRIMWVVNEILEKEFYSGQYVKHTERYMSKNRNVSIERLLGGNSSVNTSH